MVHLSCVVHWTTAAVVQRVAIKLKKKNSYSPEKAWELFVFFFLFFDEIYHAFAGDCFKLGARAIAEKCSRRSFPLLLFLCVMKNRSSGSWVVNCCPSHPSDQLTPITRHYFIKAWRRRAHTHRHTLTHTRGDTVLIYFTIQQHYRQLCYTVNNW